MASKEPRHDMPVQDAKVRVTNFNEVALGYSAETAIAEAQRCLHCVEPRCVEGCPVHVDIPDFIAALAEGDFAESAKRLKTHTSLPAICGRVCPQENQCEGKCVLGIKGESVAIGRLERFVADWDRAQEHEAVALPEKNGKKVGVVGAGPAGLACAGDLAKMGYDVTVFEALHTPGGVLMYGIPEFRLPKKIVELEVNGLKALGVKIVTNVVIGRSMSIDDLFEDGFEAVYIGSGAGLPRFMGIPGESLKEVYSANEYLTRVNLMKAYQPGSTTPIYHARKVAVVGGGNVAMDAARSAIRLGAEEVYVLYRRSFEEIPARQEEVQHAQEEQIRFQTLTNPVEILGSDDGNVTGVRCIRMELGEPDATGRRRPVPVPDSDFVIDADCVIMAIGTSPNPLIKSTTGGLEVNARGGIVADENGRTSRDGVFAGGDTVTGAATVIKAMGAGKIAAKSIDAYIQNK